MSSTETSAPLSGRKDMESWKNVTQGTHFVLRLDARGEATRHEQVNAGKTFHLTPEERRINMEKCGHESLDVFKNGTMIPVRLLDDGEEARELAANPNVMSESDMKALVTVHAKTFASKLASITNPNTLERLLAIVHSEDGSIKRAEAIEARLTAVAPGPRIAVGTSGPVTAQSDRGTYGRPVSPR